MKVMGDWGTVRWGGWQYAGGGRVGVLLVREGLVSGWGGAGLGVVGCIGGAEAPTNPPFWRTYAITVASFSLNFMTPMVNVGGEPFKIAAVAPWLGLRRAAGSVVLYQMLHTLGMLLSFLTAVALGALLLPPYPAILAGLAIAFVALAALILLLLTGHRRGGLSRPLVLLHPPPLRVRLGRRPWPKTAPPPQKGEEITP